LSAVDGIVFVRIFTNSREEVATVKRDYSECNLVSPHCQLIPQFHTPEDELQFVQPELMGGFAVIGIALLDTLADG